MIQLNSTSQTTPSLSGSQASYASPSSTSASQTDHGFQTALSAALSATLQKFGINPNSVTFSITPATTSSAAGAAAVTPFSAAETVSNAVIATPAAAATSTTTSGTTSGATSGTTSGTMSAAAASSSIASDEAYDNAYWAAQPPAVQALRNISDYSQRTELASKLSAEGYDIDVPIMVYGWDPAKITAARESYGYTWVPSAMQTPVEEAPGISTPGATAYNANNPPSGSIAV